MAWKGLIGEGIWRDVIFVHTWAWVVNIRLLSSQPQFWGEQYIQNTHRGYFELQDALR